MPWSWQNAPKFKIELTHFGHSDRPSRSPASEFRAAEFFRPLLVSLVGLIYVSKRVVGCHSLTFSKCILKPVNALVPLLGHLG